MNTELVTQLDTSIDIFDAGRIASMMTIAEQFSKAGDIIPVRFQGNSAACFVGVQMAARMDIDPFMVLQNLYVVHGTPGFSAKFLIALAERAGVIDHIEYEVTGDGDSLSVTAFSQNLKSGNRIECVASMQMAKAEGWAKNTKYKSMPVQMLSYRAACMLIRLHSPAATLGMHSVEELEVHGPMKEVSGRVIPEAPDGTKPATQASLPELPIDAAPNQEVAPDSDASTNPLTLIRHKLRGLRVSEPGFVDFVNASGKDLPPGGYDSLPDMADATLANALAAWPKCEAALLKYLDAKAANL